MNPMDAARTMAAGMSRALAGQNPNIGSPSDMAQGGFNSAARAAKGDSMGAKNHTGNNPNSSGSNSVNGPTGHNAVGGGNEMGDHGPASAPGSGGYGNSEGYGR